ncbi:MAG: hypothetical protein K2F79_07240, partial [Muribaculaceae bacterium]|nr:hypothetical protein [Muribaculaceae bacterium]
MRLISLLAAVILLGVLRLSASATPDTTVYFLNIYPGQEIYELEGHSAIVVDTGDGFPRVYNYG